MLKNGKPVYKVLLIVNVLLLTTAFIYTAMEVVQPYADWTIYVSDFICILAIVAGFIYVFKGYTKDAAKYYKIFMLLFTIREVLMIINKVASDISNDISNPTSEILCTIICSYLFVLTFAKDLGKKTSETLTIAILVITIIDVARLAILYSSYYAIMSQCAMNIAMAGVACMFVIAKYLDKSERGTK